MDHNEEELQGYVTELSGYTEGHITKYWRINY